MPFFCPGAVCAESRRVPGLLPRVLRRVALGLLPVLACLCGGDEDEELSSFPLSVTICASLAASCWRSDSSCESSDDAEALPCCWEGARREALSFSAYMPLKRWSNASAWAWASAAACAVRDAIHLCCPLKVHSKLAACTRGPSAGRPALVPAFLG